MAFVQSFPALIGRDPRVLILGSMPGAASLAAREYYAHPQNRFWPLLGTLVGASPALAYPERCQRLTGSGIALWDVLARCERAGSLDSAIVDATAQANDFEALLASHPTIRTVIFNGAKAESSFARVVAPGLHAAPWHYLRLPSSSPANASQTAHFKLRAWRGALQAAGIHTLG